MKRPLRLAAALLLFLVTTLVAAQTVSITASGSKYHVAGCRFVTKSATTLDLADAIARGYTPCSVCNPPTVVTTRPSPLAASTDKTSLYRVNTMHLQRWKDADVSRMLRAKVVRVVDGDTIHVSIDRPVAGVGATETIRLIGVDTPETVDPRKPVQAFGKQASDFAKKTLTGKVVYLAFDWNLRDKYGRLLAYVYLGNGTCFDAQLIAEGYGHAYVEFPFQFLAEFRAIEQEARAGKRGLWGS